MRLFRSRNSLSEKASVAVTETSSDVSSDDDIPNRSSPGWKPHTLRPPLLITIAVCLLGLIATLEYLSRLSQERGALATGCNGFSAASTFTFLYLPTIFSVFLSLLWSWIDLDSKRLEPYFQMSKPEGALRKDSLDLHYPFDFVALAPVKAIRNRHWAVAASGSAMLAIFWLLTPLIGAIFATRDVPIHQRKDVSYNSAIMSPDQQYIQTSNRFLTTAYKHIWADEALPAFTTPQAALLPFGLVATGTEAPSINTTWSAPTKKYSTSLSCQNATRIANGTQYSNGKTCNLRVDNFSFPVDGGIRMLYIGYWTSQINDYYLSGDLGCEAKSNENVFFGVVKGTIDGNKVVQAFFCEASYWQQDVEATVLRSNMSVIAMEALSPPVPLPSNIFNTTNFEYMMNAQTPLTSKRADIIDTSVLISHTWRLKERLGINIYMTTPLMALGLATTQQPLSVYRNLDIVIASLQNMHQLLFVLAFQNSLLTGPATSLRISGSESFVCPSIVIVRKLAIPVEVIVGLVFGLTCFMAIYNRRRASEMVQDPKSIRDVLHCLDPSDFGSKYAKCSDCEQPWNSFQMTAGIVQQREPRCRCKPQTHIKSDEMQTLEKKTRADTRSTAGSWETSKVTGSVFLMLLVAATTTIVTCNILMRSRGGMPRPSRNEVFSQLVTNYLPVAFANSLEPFWTLLSKMLCVLRPFQALAKRDSPAYESLDLKYTSLPPQLAFWRALPAGDTTLALTCMIGLSANILAVAFSGLFTGGTVWRPSTTSFPQLHIPRYEQSLNTTNGLVQIDSGVMLLVASSFANESVQQPWIWNDTFFVPFEVGNQVAKDANTRFSSHTYGLTTDIVCEKTDYDSTAYVRQPASPVKLRNGQNCIYALGAPKGGVNHTSLATEVSDRLYDEEAGGECGRSFLTGFLRANLSVSINLTKTDNYDRQTNLGYGIDALSSTWMICEQTLRVAQYFVTIDQSARVWAAEQTASDIVDKTEFFGPQLNESYFLAQNALAFSVGQNLQPWWHSDAFVDSWFGYLVKLINPAATDPAKPPPEFAQVQDTVRAIWKRTFAVQLAMNPQWLGAAASGNMILGQRTRAEAVVSMSKPAFIIVITLMIANLAAAILYYGFQRPRLERLPHLPITIGRIFELFEGSSLVLERSMISKTTSVGYGRFVGTDSRVHVGVERSTRLEEFEKSNQGI